MAVVFSIENSLATVSELSVSVPEVEESEAGMVGVIFLGREAADRAGWIADAKRRWWLLKDDGSEKQARRKRAVVGIDRRRNNMKKACVARGE